MNIRDSKEYDEYKKFRINLAHIKHYDAVTLKRNLLITELWLGKKQNIQKITLEDIGKQFCVTRERIREIYVKYITEFILYLYYKMGYALNDDIFIISMNTLSDAHKQDIINFIKQGIVRKSSNCFVSSKYVKLLNEMKEIKVV